MHSLDEIAKDPEGFRAAVREARPYKPLYVKIKIVSECNLRCRMCNHWRCEPTPPLPLERWRAIVDQLAAAGCRKLNFSGGEPALYPDLAPLIEHASSRGLGVSITTNATRIDKDLARRLASAGLRGANVSIDSPDRRLHDENRGVRGAWKEALRGFANLVRCLKRGKVRVNTVVGRRNYASLADLPDLAAEAGAGAINLVPVDVHTAEARPLKARHILRYNVEVAPVFAEKALASRLIKRRGDAYPFGTRPSEIKRTKRGLYARGYYERRRCYAPWTHALIDPLGRVKVCCMLIGGPLLGDLRERTLDEVWSGEPFAQVRARPGTPLFDTCHQCDMFLERNRVIERLLSTPPAPPATREVPPPH